MKKAPMAVALVLVFGLFAAAFSLGPVAAQYASNPTSSSNQTSTAATGTNATNTGNQTSNATGSTFIASGRLAAVIYDLAENTATSTSSTGNISSGISGNMSSSNSTMPLGNSSNLTQTITGGSQSFGSSNMTSNSTTGSTSNLTSSASSSNTTTTAAVQNVTGLPYIIAGDWNLDVNSGNVTDFKANFTMVHTDGTGRHVHEVSNFQANSSTVQLVKDGTTFIFGTSDVSVNGTTKWTGVNTLVVIEKMSAVSIALSTDDDHFKGQPIYGVVDSLTENGTQLIQTQLSQTNTASANNTSTTNQTGGFLGNVTQGLQNITGIGK